MQISLNFLTFRFQQIKFELNQHLASVFPDSTEQEEISTEHSSPSP